MASVRERLTQLQEMAERVLAPAEQVRIVVVYYDLRTGEHRKGPEFVIGRSVRTEASK